MVGKRRLHDLLIFESRKAEWRSGLSLEQNTLAPDYNVGRSLLSLAARQPGYESKLLHKLILRGGWLVKEVARPTLF